MQIDPTNPQHKKLISDTIASVMDEYACDIVKRPLGLVIELKQMVLGAQFGTKNRMQLLYLLDTIIDSLQIENATDTTEDETA